VQHDGKGVDLYHQGVFALRPRGTGEIVAGEGGSYLRLEAGAPGCLVNGQQADDGRRLETGDVIGLGEESVLLIVR
jgi:hypothetical protein